MMKNAFYFTLKAICVLRYLNVCADFLGHAGKLLGEKAKVN